MANEQPAGYVCNGCGRLARDLEQDMQKLKEGNFLSCCPERKMLPVYTRPAAPVEGLETVEPLYGPKTNICWTQDNTPKEHRKIVQLMAEGDYVTRSQAETIIAAKDDLIDKCKWQVRDTCVRAEKAEAVNAALTARVKELENINADLCRSHGVLNVTGSKLETKVETLETQLAAARKALEPFALISSEGVISTKSGHVTVTTCAEYFHEARATLEDRP